MNTGLRGRVPRFPMDALVNIATAMGCRVHPLDRLKSAWINTSMTYTELLAALQNRTHYQLIPVPADDFLAEVSTMIYNWCALTSPQSQVERTAVVNALGPLRRRFMAGEGAAQDFLRLNQIIEAIDAVFDNAATRPRP
ncbi:hypothetical protein CAP31_10905 [Sulfuriferula sp. AH1]|uniref:hypothetical protein n=1 Tax=Sulfuriferula sp. AH1 TaxID=1985873 RepID=UPI000B3B75E3|nr:hypothetical protein [Sulfuriferula sp. AH1]ARU32142.1 hypothetical protein CAP31_10905 [Sulfuriferula sp. AH1]